MKKNNNNNNERGSKQILKETQIDIIFFFFGVEARKAIDFNRFNLPIHFLLIKLATHSLKDVDIYLLKLLT